jgi:hypothetical protein
MDVLYKNEAVMLYQENGSLRLTDGDRTYTITDYPYEPCLYLTRDDGSRTTIHNSFKADWIASAAKEGGTLESLSGNKYDTDGLCRLMLLAARETADADLPFIESLGSTGKEEPAPSEKPVYCIKLKDGTLRERIEEMMSIAGDGPERTVGIKALRALYASEQVPIYPAGERFLRRYAYLFSQLTPGFGNEEDDIQFCFETFDETDEEDGRDSLKAVHGRSRRATQASGGPVTPVGYFGFDDAPAVYAGEDGLLYAYSGDSDPVRTYRSLPDLLEDELQGHLPLGLDD